MPSAEASRSMFWIAAPVAIRSLSLLYESAVSIKTTIRESAAVIILAYFVNSEIFDRRGLSLIIRNRHGWLFKPEGAHLPASSIFRSIEFLTGLSLNLRIERRLRMMEIMPGMISFRVWLAIIAVYFVVTSALGLLFFERKEFT